MGDPCAAKFKAKQGLSTAGMSSMPNLPTASDLERPDSTSSSAKLNKSPSDTGFGLTSATMKRRRDLARMSSISHFLDQSKGLIDPTWTSGARPRPGPHIDDLQELHYAGVSQEGEGRHGYLKARKAFFPQEKKEVPETSFQDVGWNVYLGKGKFIAKVPKPSPPKPSTIIIS